VLERFHYGELVAMQFQVNLTTSCTEGDRDVDDFPASLELVV
jgi:hypothetical protein